MRLLFDLTKTQPIGCSKYHGGGKYGLVVFKHLLKLAPEKLAVYYNSNLYLDEETLELIHSYRLKVYLANDITIIQAAKLEGGILYSPLFSSNYLNKDVTIVTTIHGLRTLELPSDKYEIYYREKRSWKVNIILKLGLQNFYTKWFFRKELKYFRNVLSYSKLHFVTVSNHSKASIISYIPSLVKNDIKVFYSPSTIDHSINLCNYKRINGKYWLIVSGNRWLKNSLRAILAFDELFSERPDIEGRVVITGLNDLKFDRIKIKNPHRFICKGYVDEKELKGLYHFAYLLVYPSLNEGFGYPPLEAMYEGCPVIASAIASIPEICGDAVLYFNPFLCSEIKMRIIQMENVNLRNEFAKKSLERQFIIEEKQNKDLHDLCKYIFSFID